MKINSMCVITDGYPSENRVANAFVETLINEIADKGIKCVVIAPQSISKSLKVKDQLEPYHRTRKTSKGNNIHVYSPKYISMSVKRIGKLNLAEVTLGAFKYAAESVFKKLHKDYSFDVVYGHFINPSGIVANSIGRKYNIPAFFAYGENGLYSIEYLGVMRTRKLLNNICGVISVSSLNKRVLEHNSIIEGCRIGVFPNSIDENIFYRRNMTEMRKKHGFPEDAFIVAFVGRFLPVKGPDRLEKAIELLHDDGIYTIFIGNGDYKPSSKNILFCGTTNHELVPEYLSAADIFVLPTLAEGCCNAIVEAMACGLPVISSNLPFNDDILDSSCSIQVDTANIEEISNAIRQLRQDSNLRVQLAKGAIEKSSSLTIEKRADNILSFINEMILSSE